MRRFLLSSAAVCSLALIALTAAMWTRSFRIMDWFRIRAGDHAAVFASSQAHVGAAIVIDGDEWSSGDRPVRYRHFRAADLRRQFPGQALGFAYREERGVRLVLLPMWALVALGLAPPALWVAQRPRRAPRNKTCPPPPTPAIYLA